MIRELPKDIRKQIVPITFIHTVLFTGYRMVYPFLPAIARGLGVSYQAVSLGVTIRASFGVLTPFLGSISDIRGRKVVLVWSLIIFAGGMVLMDLAPTLIGLYIGLILTALGRMMFDPTSRAYLGDRVPIQQQGMAIALTEIGWSASSLIAMPIMGLAIASGDWTTPLPWLAGSAVVGAVLMQISIPPDAKNRDPDASWRGNLAHLFNNKSAVTGIAIGFITAMAMDMVMIAYAVWLEGSFGFKVAALGATGILLGFAELCGEGVIAAYSDRLGMRKSLGLGIGFTILASLLLPGLEKTLVGALAGLFLFSFGYESVVVAIMPFTTGIVPKARATALSTLMAARAGGHALGAFIGSKIIAETITRNALLSGGLNLAALLLLLLFVRKPEQPEETGEAEQCMQT